MPSRRFHHKSASGCKECKLQRVKCDETRPSCNRCNRQGRTCSYTRDSEAPAVLKPAQTSNAGTESPNPAPAPAPATVQPVPSFADPVIPNAEAPPAAIDPLSSYSHTQDLELVHHWTLSACNSFNGGYGTGSDDMLGVWKDAAVKQALKYPFLMHAIFSFSALHLVSSLSQDLAPSRDRWLKRSAHDYGLALTLARAELKNINPHNCHAVFAFSTIVAITRMAMPTVTGDYGDGILDHMAQTFQLLRGIPAVLKVAFGWIKAGPMSAAMQDIDDFEPRPIDPDIRDALEALELRVPGVVEDRGHREAYYDAIQRMRLYFTHPHKGGSATYSAGAWPVLLQAEYMDDLAAKKPMALCLLAYYGLMLDEQKAHWFMQDHGKRMLVAVIQELDEEWMPYIQVPRNRIKPEVLYSVMNFRKTAAPRAALGEPAP